MGCLSCTGWKPTNFHLLKIRKFFVRLHFFLPANTSSSGRPSLPLLSQPLTPLPTFTIAMYHTPESAVSIISITHLIISQGIMLCVTGSLAPHRRCYCHAVKLPFLCELSADGDVGDGVLRRCMRDVETLHATSLRPST